jgi:biotin carboxylase
MRLHLVASRPTDSVTYGFLPAAARLGLDVTVLTDQPEAHEREYAGRTAWTPFPGAPGREDYPPPRIERCDVFQAQELIAAVTALPAPDAVASNSDHLQAQTALAAAYLGLPGKDWRSALRGKHKPLMRRQLAQAGVEKVRVTEIPSGTANLSGDSLPATSLPYPVVLKPADGVASEDVVLVGGPDELARRCAAFFARHPGRVLLAEEFLPGRLRTMETLGDGTTRWVLGGFRTTVSPPPYFVEERLAWDPPDAAAQAHVSAALDALGVSFGACHTEYMSGPATRLVEVNDRVIGDHCDFLLAYLLRLPLFELILRVHLGDLLPPVPPAVPPDRAYAIADYVTAERSGVLAEVPPAMSHVTASHVTGRPGVRLAHWPLRQPGDSVTLTGTNRDYLGVICAAGPDQRAVEDAVRELRGQLCWEIR